MTINFRKKDLFVIAVFLTFSIFSFQNSKADITSADINVNLNTETKTFIARINNLPTNFLFNQNLKRGKSISPDVQYLKWVLNSDIRTALTDNPNMMLDQLTSAFGPLTEDAVKRFQTVYRADILDPQGIANATGIIGKATRQKINSLMIKSRLVANYSDTLNTALTQQISDNPNSTPNVINNSTTSTSTETNSNSNHYVDFSYLNSLNLDNILSDYTTTTDITQLNQSLAIASSSLYQTTDQTNTINNTNINSTINSTTSSTNISTTNTNNSGSNGSSISSSGGVGSTLLIGGGLIAGAGLLSGLGSKLGGATAAVTGSAGSTAGSVGSTAGTATNGATNLATNAFYSQVGGTILMVKPCTCSGGYSLTIFNLSTMTPLSVLFQPGFSVLKMNYHPTVGQIILAGIIVKPTACLIYSGNSCVPFGLPVGIIDLRGVGTTLTVFPGAGGTAGGAGTGAK